MIFAIIDLSSPVKISNYPIVMKIYQHTQFDYRFQTIEPDKVIV
jgi:hypothetical protein